MDIVVSFPGEKKVTSAEYKGFTIRTGQPESSGGDGSAPTPFDLFLVSIATCAAAYALYFCDNRGIPTSDIRIVERIDRDPESHMVKKISIDVELPADFPSKYVKALLKSVDMCTVKKHLFDPPEFDIKAVLAD